MISIFELLISSVTFKLMCSRNKLKNVHPTETSPRESNPVAGRTYIGRIRDEMCHILPIHHGRTIMFFTDTNNTIWFWFSCFRTRFLAWRKMMLWKVTWPLHWSHIETTLIWPANYVHNAANPIITLIKSHYSTDTDLPLYEDPVGVVVQNVS